MKKHGLLLMAILSLLLLLVTSHVYADSLVIDTNTKDGYYNPGLFKPDNPTAEKAWLTALLGFDPGDYLGKDEKNWNDGNWTEGTASE